MLENTIAAPAIIGLGSPVAGRSFLDRELYLPKVWTDDRERCMAAGIPATRGCDECGEPGLEEFELPDAGGDGLRLLCEHAQHVAARRLPVFSERQSLSDLVQAHAQLLCRPNGLQTLDGGLVVVPVRPVAGSSPMDS